MEKPKYRGVLMHVTSLWSGRGIGSMGAAARAFVDFLAEAGLTLWQVLPLGPTGCGNSPYQSPSAFAGSPLLIDLDALASDGLLTREELESCSLPDGETADYDAVTPKRSLALRTAFARFAFRPPADFAVFTAQNAEWLDDYARFAAIKRAQEQRPWNEWPENLRDHESAGEPDAEETAFRKFEQYEFFTQWTALKRYANGKGVRIIGDMPIYAAYDSADVWSAPELFQLDERLRPKRVAGVPPDAFSRSGQLWGNPLYDWKAMESDGYRWWMRRLNSAMRLFDVVRIDHFRGFDRYYSVRYGASDATKGRWLAGPGKKLFDALSAGVPQARVVAEDLGLLDERVRRLVRKTGYPGMKVYQFGFGSDRLDAYLPENYPYNCAAYTGTHDNDTTRGWFEALDGTAQRRVREILGYDGDDLPGEMVRRLFASQAEYALAPMQDLLRLDGRARMNLPGTGSDNWRWRMVAPPTGSLASEVRGWIETPKDE